jgi:flagellar protein FliS
MTYGAVRARYADDTALTASPARLLTMLYDRLVRDLATGEDAMNRKDIEQTGELLGRAQEILLELRASLDLSVWPEGGPLAELYLWMVQELMQARLKLDPDRVRACRELIEPLRDAWRAAAVQTAMTEAGDALGGTPMAAAGARPGGQG